MNDGLAADRRIRQLLGWLGDREEHVRLALEAADLAPWHWNPTLGELYWSERCRQLLDVDPDEPASIELFKSRVHPDDRAAVDAAIQEALRSGGAYSEEFRVVHRDGAIHRLHAMGRAQSDRTPGSTQRMSGVLRDITDSWRARVNLERERDAYLQLIEASPAAIAKFDRNMCYLAANRKFTDFLGLDPANLLGRCHYEVVPHLAEYWRSIHRRALNGEDVSGVGDTFVHADGTRDETSWRAMPWRDAHGDVGGIVVIIEVMAARRRITDRGLFWASAFRCNPHAMAIVDAADSSVLDANNACGRLMDLPPLQCAGRSLFTLFPESEHSRLRDALAAVDSLGTSTTELRRLQGDGRQTPTRLNLIAVRNVRGELLCRVSMITDVPEQMPERAVSDRTHSQTRLLVQRLLELREVERNELASELQYDVYRDLTAVSSGLHGLLADTSGGGATAQSLATVAALADTALNGLRRVLFDLNPPGVMELGFAAALARYVAELSARSGVGITLTQPQEPLQLRQDLQAVVYTVVLEGIKNAVEHSQASQIEVTVTAGADALRIRVSDNGVGIRDADRQRPGCFGLLASMERIQQLGGSLRVLGIVGSGTHFEISVPTGR